MTPAPNANATLNETRLTAIHPATGGRELLKLWFSPADDEVKAALETCRSLGYRRPRVSRHRVPMSL